MPCHEGDGDGHIKGKHGGKAHFHFENDDQCEHERCDRDHERERCDRDHEPEHVDYKDPRGRSGSAAAGIKFHSTRFLSVEFDDAAHSLTVIGKGRDNGKPVTFIMVAVDNGASKRDTFSIVLSDGYSNTGHLLDGRIVLHSRPSPEHREQDDIGVPFAMRAWSQWP
jgi:hypothetical protein